jgi:hypothetical protein
VGRRSLVDFASSAAMLALAGVSLAVIQKSTSLVTALLIFFAISVTAGLTSLLAVRRSRDNSDHETRFEVDETADSGEVEPPSPLRRSTGVVFSPKSLEELRKLPPHTQSKILDVIDEIKKKIDVDDIYEGYAGSGILWRRGVTRSERGRGRLGAKGQPHPEGPEGANLVVFYAADWIQESFMTGRRFRLASRKLKPTIYVLRIVDAQHQARIVAAVKARESTMRFTTKTSIDDELRSILADLGIG